MLLGRKAMTNLDSILKKNRDSSLPAKVHIVKAMVFPIGTYWCESWSVKNAERCFHCGAGEVAWESLGLQGFKPVSPKGKQHWIFIGKTLEVDSDKKRIL